MKGAKMRTTIAVALAFGLGMAFAMPAEAAKVSMIGVRSCGQWVADRAERGAAGALSTEWPLGFG